jgi:hypothetical protein
MSTLFRMTGHHNPFPIETSDYYQQYLLEQKEIDKIEWLESERVGTSIGRERAEWIWFTRYRNQWRRAQISGQST